MIPSIDVERCKISRSLAGVLALAVPCLISICTVVWVAGGEGLLSWETTVTSSPAIWALVMLTSLAEECVDLAALSRARDQPRRGGPGARDGVAWSVCGLAGGFTWTMSGLGSGRLFPDRGRRDSGSPS